MRGGLPHFGPRDPERPLMAGLTGMRSAADNLKTATEVALTMEIETTEMVVKVRFDRVLEDRQTSEMAQVIAQALEPREGPDGQPPSPGWQIGPAKVVAVEQLLPGDLIGLETPTMLALRLEKAGFLELADEARAGKSRAALLTLALEVADPDPTALEIIVGRLAWR